MTQSFATISPVDGRKYVERPLASCSDIERALGSAVASQPAWGALGLAERCAVLGRAVDLLVGRGSELAAEITWQMGRPARHAPSEIRGLEERARYMLGIAPEALSDIRPQAKPGFRLRIRRVPLGVVVVIAPWNYPYLTAVNALLPALIAGNTVILKHSHQTPLCAERFFEAFAGAGVPPGVFQYLHASHEDTARLIGDRRVAGVCFTGSVAGGRAVVAATAAGFASAGLELGGKDPAYVCEDANLAHAIETLTDGAFFNAGQSCCGIKRIYVSAPRYNEFVDGMVSLAEKYRLGSPLDPDTTLGPVVRPSAASAVRAQVSDALSRGARQLVDQGRFAASRDGTAYLAPQILIDVDHTMPIMREETFGPAIGIMPVSSDQEALRLMNDSDYGLTAAVFCSDVQRAERLAEALATGTVFLNRCDYLDPALAWTGIKNSGRGCTLSVVGFEQLTRPKSLHFRTLP
ncbi:MAG TPA: aldehyde dehydrogenase family protein [Steroidobacteraceae bacterium]|nr:aldehyde dehydrogenase family protein [Steroidobacteraceae bacterium]